MDKQSKWACNFSGYNKLFLLFFLIFFETVNAKAICDAVKNNPTELVSMIKNCDELIQSEPDNVLAYFTRGM